MIINNIAQSKRDEKNREAQFAQLQLTHQYTKARESSQWLNTEKLRHYSAFLRDALAFMKAIQSSYENERFDTKKLDALRFQLRQAEVIMLANDEVTEAYEVLVDQLRDFYQSASNDTDFSKHDELMGKEISTALAIRTLENAMRLDRGLPANGSNIVGYTTM
ncbi:hypothetical protein [Arthrobacter sp. AG1021]|uniref:hypothetical protein n=1 Tax=Arthrobacter sp. AG1021 TaxID=2183908 RepID=UPI0011C498FE|nr:hypothetical protein [Arthrobacter sp. AG1021]